MPTISASEPLGADLVGTPYIRGGRDPGVGLDCLGVVLEIHRRAGISVSTPDGEPTLEHYLRTSLDEIPGLEMPLDVCYYRRRREPAVAALVAPGVVLTSMPKAGVVLARARALLRGVSDVRFYRVRRDCEGT